MMEGATETASEAVGAPGLGDPPTTSTNTTNSEPNPRQTDPQAWRSIEPAANGFVEDFGNAMVVEEEMHDADAPESQRRRTSGELDVSVSSNLVSVCVLCPAVSELELDRVRLEDRGQCERESRFVLCHGVRASDAKGKRFRSRWIDEYKMKG